MFRESRFREDVFRNSLSRGTSRNLRRFFPPILFLLAGLIAAVIPFRAMSDEKTPAKVIEDMPAGAMQAKATTSCLECHEARIILQQRLSKGAWTKEVDKMIKWGAVVDAADHDALIDYLSTNFSPDMPPYEPPRSAPEKTAAKIRK